MHLHGQLKRAARAPESGYAMAALLVAMAVMAILMSVAMPAWNHAAQREKESELVFRGEQYVRAIGLFERKYANTPPPTLDVLVQERFLRRKYKDPITNGDFVPILATQAAAATPGGAGSNDAGRGATAPTPRPTQSIQPVAGAPGSGVISGGGGIVGVTSASKQPSIRIYNGGMHYNEWRFIYAAASATPGTAVSGTGGPGPGGRQGQPGQPGGFGVGPGGNRGGRGGRGPMPGGQPGRGIGSGAPGTVAPFPVGPTAPGPVRGR